MKITVRTGNFHLHITKSAQCIAYCRNTFVIHCSIRNNYTVAFKQVFMCCNKITKVNASYLFFAFYQKLYIYGENFILCKVRLKCFEMDKYLAFIIGRAAGENIFPPYIRFKRRGGPKV